MDIHKIDSFGLIIEASDVLGEVAKKADQEIERHVEGLHKCLDSFDKTKEQFSHIYEALDIMNKAFTNIASNVNKNDTKLNHVIEEMLKLEEDANSIKNQVKTINNVSDQISLIALNASIQAARVGEGGKSFRIVAAEVEKLAGTTNRVNKAIGEIVTTVQNSVQNVSQSINEIRKTIANSLINVQSSRESLTSATANMTGFRNNLFDGMDNFFAIEEKSRDIGGKFKELSLVGESLSSLLEGLYFEGDLREINFEEHISFLMKGTPFVKPTSETSVVKLDRDLLFVFVLDRYGVFKYLNENVINVFGHHLKEIQGKNLELLFHPDMPPVILEDMRLKIRNGRPWVGLVKNKIQKGEHIWTRISLFPIIKERKVTEFVALARGASAEEIVLAKRSYFGEK
ncbi:MAG: methyl-accepting chemotaxis protein [Bacteriovoracaceae bacterium]